MNIIKGDLIQLAKEGYFDVIVHGCNCFHNMGAGIAKQISNEWPEVSRWDSDFTSKGDPSKLGSVKLVPIKINDNLTIRVVNAYTQYFPGYVRDKELLYNSIRFAFYRLNRVFPGKSLRIGYPKIGCGLASGDWDIVSKIIDEELKGRDHTFVEYDKLYN